jgi:hypothetical protein
MTSAREQQQAPMITSSALLRVGGVGDRVINEEDPQGGQQNEEYDRKLAVTTNHTFARNSKLPALGSEPQRGSSQRAAPPISEAQQKVAAEGALLPPVLRNVEVAVLSKAFS